MSLIFHVEPLCSPFCPVVEAMQTRLLVDKVWGRGYVFLNMPGSVTKIYQADMYLSLSEWAMTYVEESLLSIVGFSSPLPR